MSSFKISHETLVELIFQHTAVIADIVAEKSDTGNQTITRRIRLKGRFSTDYTETNWGRFIADPETADPLAKRASYFAEDSGFPFVCFDGSGLDVMKGTYSRYGERSSFDM